ncbi:MAG: SCO family protein [Gammaproteobacteria bacterium]|nr:SCO family protein [Gammaproteobacteria bacterium]MDH3904730.1 SCO family protein [Gammaproteobacteria bacterium]MDH4005915.1 SCO family protein [Gammaproteobacteria bacterium]
MFKPIQNLLAGSAALALMLCIAAPADIAVAGTTSADKAAAEAKARDYFTNVELIDQDGQRLKFYDDVLKDNIVVISFIFTNCQGACPLMTRNLTMIRDMLPGNVRDEIHFISISLDPVRDTPAAMKEFAQTHDADQESWLWLTGQPDNVNLVTKKLGTYTDELEAHTTMLIAANVRESHWTKIAPNVPPKGVAERLRLLVEDNAAP